MNLTGILLTQNNTFIIGPIAKLLGYIMEGIFFVLDKVGIPNIGLAIILFTIVMYMLLMPLTVKQQKFSKLSAKMNPELQAIQAKYKNRKDNESMMAMNQETQEVYAKYGVSPSGSCLQLVIQMPILFALYRVIYAMPAYVGKIKEAFFPLVSNLISQQGSTEFVKSLSNSSMFKNQFTNELFTSGNSEYIQNTFIDCLNRASTADWASLAEKFPSLAGDVANTLEKINHYNNFLGLNMANSPSFTVKTAFANGNWLLIIGAILIPVLSALTQWINTKLMPQAASNSSNGNSTADTMAQSMKTMNIMMPLMSAFFCYTLPAGMGLYWIAGAVVRSIQQVIINKHIDKIDMDELIKTNVEKNKKKLEKKGINSSKLANYASMSTKNVNAANMMNQAEKEAAVKKSYENNANAKPGSIAAKANLVKQYNEKNNK